MKRGGKEGKKQDKKRKIKIKQDRNKEKLKVRRSNGIKQNQTTKKRHFTIKKKMKRIIIDILQSC